MEEAHRQLKQIKAESREFKTEAERHIASLTEALKPVEDIEEVAVSDLPSGYILWFHSHVNPQVAALAEEDNVEILLEPHSKARVSSTTPEGIHTEIDQDRVAAELRSFPGQCAFDCVFDYLVPTLVYVAILL